MNHDDLSNDELDTLAATDIMGWHLGGLEYVHGPLMHGGSMMRSWEGSNGEHTGWLEDGWHPTAEGHEHQAFMVVRKMQKFDRATQWYFMDFLRKMTPHTEATLEWLLWQADFGRATILAALKAKEVEDANPTRD